MSDYYHHKTKEIDCGGEIEFWDYSCDDPECGCGHVDYYWRCEKCGEIFDWEDLEKFEKED
jgi:hypothetical protein